MKPEVPETKDVAKETLPDIRMLFGIDTKKAVEGTWIEFGNGFAVFARRADDNNTEFQLAKSKVFAEAEFSRRMQMGMVTQKDLNKVNSRLWADHVILDWRGVVLDGKEVPFSKEKFLEVVNMDCMTDFLEMILTATANRRNFRWEETEKK
jgi:hypothetical protein